MDILLGERGHWAINYTVTQSYKSTLNSYLLVLRLLILIGWFKISVQAFQQMILIFNNGNFFSSLGMYIDLSSIVLSL